MLHGPARVLGGARSLSPHDFPREFILDRGTESMSKNDAHVEIGELGQTAKRRYGLDLHPQFLLTISVARRGAAAPASTR